MEWWCPPCRSFTKGKRKLPYIATAHPKLFGSISTNKELRVVSTLMGINFISLT